MALDGLAKAIAEEVADNPFGHSAYVRACNPARPSNRKAGGGNCIKVLGR
jgi:hypothetical protein